MPMPLKSRLWIVATPLGNPGDLSPRAREILAEADLVLAEDTRRAEKLFRECGVRPKKISSFFEHNEEAKQSEIIEALLAGANIALISDAGTPLLADPGYRLVRACHKLDIQVSPVPGPSAPIAALSAAGIAPLPFTFLGFLPRGIAERQKIFRAFQATPGSIIFFERKDRLEESLSIAYAILGEREMAICRELTKTYEQIIPGPLEAWHELSAELAGEITVVIGPTEKTVKTDEEQAIASLRAELDKGCKLRQAAKNVQKFCPGWSVAELYNLAAKENL